MYPDLSIFEENIGYRFKNRQLLLAALTHSSYANESDSESVGDNERLEFLGDAVLELVSSDFLYKSYPDMAEGEMTKLRASLVCERALAECAVIIDLATYIRLGKGEEKTGGRKRKSIISDAMEAVIGAIYLDGGIEPARTYIEGLMLEDIENRILFSDSKTTLQEVMQAKNEEPQYVLVGESGPDHCKEFTMEVVVDGVAIGTGIGNTKKEAQQEAARQALLALREKDVS